MTQLPWWSAAVIYQVYVQSFADSDGDGIGDLDGVRARLPYLRRARRRRDLVHPVLPVAAGGRGLRRGRLPRHRPGLRHPRRRRRADRRGAPHGIRTIIDIVPNHCSDEHPWFQAALAAPPGSRRARAVLVPPRPRRARRPAAEQLAVDLRRPGLDPDDRPGRHAGEWYLHLFAPEQPDFNWDNPEVRGRVRGHPAVLVRPRRRRHPDRLGRPAVKDPALPDAGPPTRRPTRPRRGARHLPGLARGRRRVPRPGADRRDLAARRRAGSPGTCAPTSCTRRSTSSSCAVPGTPPACARSSTARWPFHAAAGAPATWVLSNHDVARHVTRYGRADTLVRAWTGATTASPSTWRWAPAGPGPPPC